MRKLIALIIFTAVIFGTYHLYKQQAIDLKSASSSKPTIKIGASLPLTGNFANSGLVMKNSILLAKQDLAQRYLKNNYEFIIEDDAFEARKVITNFNKFKSIDHVNAITSFASMTGQIIAPQAQEAGILYINFGASDKNIAQGDHNFIHWTQPHKTAGKMVDFYLQKGFKKVAFVGGMDSGVQTIQQTFSEIAKQNGLEVELFYFQPSERDFRLTLSKIENQFNPDVYLALVWGGQLNPFVKQYHELGIKKPLTNIEIFATVDDINVIENTYYSDVPHGSPDFYNRLKEAYPTTPNEFASGFVYDAIMLMVTAFEAAPSPNQAALTLAKIKEYDGQVGRLTQDQDGIFHSEAVIKHVVNGTPIIVE